MLNIYSKAAEQIYIRWEFYWWTPLPGQDDGQNEKWTEFFVHPQSDCNRGAHKKLASPTFRGTNLWTELAMIGHQLSIFYRWFELFRISAGNGARAGTLKLYARKRIFHIHVYFAPRQRNFALAPCHTLAMEYSSFEIVCRGNGKIAYRRVFVRPRELSPYRSANVSSHYAMARSCMAHIRCACVACKHKTHLFLTLRKCQFFARFEVNFSGIFRAAMHSLTACVRCKSFSFSHIDHSVRIIHS